MTEYIQFPNGKRIEGIAAPIIAIGFLVVIFLVGFALGAIIS